MSLNYLQPMFYIGAGVPSYYAMTCDDDLATVTTESYVDSNVTGQGLVLNNGDLFQTIYGDGTKSCVFASSINAETSASTLVPIAGINMS
jgi:hypothetical protein